MSKASWQGGWPMLRMHSKHDRQEQACPSLAKLGLAWLALALVWVRPCGTRRLLSISHMPVSGMTSFPDIN
jgi:hypothetical protein